MSTKISVLLLLVTNNNNKILFFPFCNRCWWWRWRREPDRWLWRWPGELLWLQWLRLRLVGLSGRAIPEHLKDLTEQHGAAALSHRQWRNYTSSTSRWGTGSRGRHCLRSFPPSHHSVLLAHHCQTKSHTLRIFRIKLSRMRRDCLFRKYIFLNFGTNWWGDRQSTDTQSTDR